MSEIPSMAEPSASKLGVPSGGQAAAPEGGTNADLHLRVAKAMQDAEAAMQEGEAAMQAAEQSMAEAVNRTVPDDSSPSN